MSDAIGFGSQIVLKMTTRPRWWVSSLISDKEMGCSSEIALTHGGYGWPRNVILIVWWEGVIVPPE
jgi:hypothetical protein